MCVCLCVCACACVISCVLRSHRQRLPVAEGRGVDLRRANSVRDDAFLIARTPFGDGGFRESVTVRLSMCVM